MAATVPAPCSARPRLQPPRAAVRARQSTGPRRSPVSAAAAAAPRGGGDSSSSLNPSRDSSSRKTTTTASAAASLDFATSCPWPRPPSYQEPVEKRRSLGSRVALVVAKVKRLKMRSPPPPKKTLGRIGRFPVSISLFRPRRFFPHPLSFSSFSVPLTSPPDTPTRS